MDYTTRRLLKRRSADKPRKDMYGEKNVNFKHGGYCVELMTPEEKEQFARDIETYLAAYPFLREAIMMDLLLEYVIIKIRLQRIRNFLFDPNIPEKDKLGAEKLADMLRRTMSLYATRMGLSYVSRQRRKPKPERKTPLEILTEK